MSNSDKLGILFFFQAFKPSDRIYVTSRRSTGTLTTIRRCTSTQPIKTPLEDPKAAPLINQLKMNINKLSDPKTINWLKSSVKRFAVNFSSILNNKMKFKFWVNMSYLTKPCNDVMSFKINLYLTFKVILGWSLFLIYGLRGGYS